MSDDDKQLTTKEQILICARKLFSSKGFAETSVRDIAKAAGQNLALISYHFGSKEGLLEAIISDFTEAFRTSIPPMKEGESMEERIATIIGLHVQAVRENEESWRIAFRIILDSDPGTRSLLRQHIVEIIFTSFGIEPKELHGDMLPELPWYIGGSVLASMAYSSFIFKPIIEDITGKALGDAFFERYGEILKQLFLDGANSFMP